MTWKIKHQGQWHTVKRIEERAALGQGSDYHYHVEGKDPPIPGHEVEQLDMGDGSDPVKKSHPMKIGGPGPSVVSDQAMYSPRSSVAAERRTAAGFPMKEMRGQPEEVGGAYNPNTRTAHVMPQPGDTPKDMHAAEQHEATHAQQGVLFALKGSSPSSASLKVPQNADVAVSHELNKRMHPSAMKLLSAYVQHHLGQAKEPDAAGYPGMHSLDELKGKDHISELNAYANTYLHDPQFRGDLRKWMIDQGMDDSHIIGFDHAMKSGYKNAQKWFRSISPDQLIGPAARFKRREAHLDPEFSYVHHEGDPLNDSHTAELAQLARGKPMKKLDVTEPVEKSAFYMPFDEAMNAPKPPAIGAGMHFDPDQKAKIAVRHDMMAGKAAASGNHETAAYHRQHAQAYRDAMGKAEGKTIPYDELVAEHEKLVSDLKSGDKDKLDAQAKDQAEELDEYKKEAKKAEHVEMAPDGKRELVPGKEPLNKEPIKKSLSEEWELLKAKISADKAFLDIDEQVGDKDKGAEQSAPPPEGGEQPPEQAPPEGGEQPPEQAPPEGGPGPDQAPPEQGAPPPEQAPPEGGEQLPEDDSQLGMQDGEKVQLLEQKLREDGYSESEIAHIIHGHVIPTPTVEDHKSYNEHADGEMDREHTKAETALKHAHMAKMNELEQAKRKAELDSIDPDSEKQHKQKMKDIEYAKKKAELDALDPESEKAHKLKMKGLEYDRAKKQADADDHEDERDHKRKIRELELDAKRAEIETSKKERDLELKYKEKELQLKLKLQEESARQKAEFQAKQAEEDAKVNAACKKEQAKFKIAESKKPPVKEKSDGK